MGSLLLGEDKFKLKTPPPAFVVRVVRIPLRPDLEQTRRARLALSALRSAVAARDPRVLDALRSIVAALDGSGFSSTPPRRLGASLLDAAFEAELLERVADELERGRLVIELEELPSLTDRRELTLPELPPPPPRAEEPPGTHAFELRLLDEVGQAIPSVELELAAGGEKLTRSTNAGGVGLFEQVKASSAVASVIDPVQLLEVVDQRWAQFRPGKPPNETRTKQVTFDGGALPGFALKPELPHTLVIRPPPAKLALELIDKRGRTPHAKRPYRLLGPVSFGGITDDDGRLVHDEVPNGDYALELDVEQDVGREAPEKQTLLAAAVALPVADASPQLRALGAIPSAKLVRLRGLFFDTNKSFVLPAGLIALRDARPTLLENSPAELLIVGHTDTSGQPDYNERLSLERAQSVQALLEHDRDAWLANYESSRPPEKRWGTHEDAQMLQALPDFDEKPERADPLRWFQRTRLLKVDGAAGPETRTQLVKEYMQLVGVPFVADPGIALKLTCHGCGENFPLDESGEELDQAPADGADDQLDRRVELFLFDPDLGIRPPPPGPTSAAGSTEYPAWRKRAELERDELAPTRLIRLRLLDDQGQPQDGAQYRARLERELHFGVAKGGVVELNTALRGVECRLEWNPKGAEPLGLFGGTPVNRSRVFIDPRVADDEAGARRMLHNLGYDFLFGLETALQSFQVDEGLDASGVLDSPTQQRLNDVYSELLRGEA